MGRQRKRVRRTLARRGPVRFGEPVEQADANSERELLAGDRVDQALEQGRKPRRLQSAEACRERAQKRVALGNLVERGKVELEAELETLRLQYNDNYPDVKRAKRKVEVFENAIKEILG